MSDIDSTPQTLGMSLAGSAIIIALLKQLTETGALTVPEVRGVLQSASNLLANFYGTAAGREAGKVIRGLFAHFPEVVPEHDAPLRS